MNRLSPFAWAGIGVVATALLGAAAYGFIRGQEGIDNRDQPEQEETVVEDTPCVTTDTVVFEDPSLELAVKEALYADEENQAGPVYCADMEMLESLTASGRDIFSLRGLEHASALVYLDLSENSALVNTDALVSLDQLTYLNLTGSNISDRSPFLTDVFWPALTELYLGNNGLREIQWLTQMPALQILALQNNSIATIEPLFDQHALTSLFLYNNPLDLSVESEDRNVIETLQERSVEVVWDELALTLGIGDVGTRRKTVEAPETLELVARVSTSEIDPTLEVDAVEFFKVTANGVLSTLGVDETAPYSMEVSFGEQDIGKTFQYAAEVVTTYGARYLLVPNQYASVTVVEAPECRVHADCADSDQCTEDTCVGGECRQQQIPSCADTEISCNDGIDNDRDGEPDCNDSECFEDPACVEDEPAPPETCNVDKVLMGCYMSSADGKICTLRVSNGKCNVGVVKCDSTGCYYDGSGQPYDWYGCPLEQTLLSLGVGEKKEVPGYQCAGLNLCKRIILCAE